MDIDIIGLCENHLDKDKFITITDYTYIDFKREMQHVKAPHAFGGVGILIHDRIYANYNVSIFDKSFDGILGIEIVNKHTDVRCIYFVCYLPPERSPYSRDIDAVYAHLITQLYLANEADMIFLAGDFNARICSNTDTFDGLDDTIIPERKVLDLTSNKHGSTLIDFLISSSTSVLNGRFPDSIDNYTCIRNGKSVVDYFICPHTCFKHCKRFDIELISSLITLFNLQHLVSERSKIPDHSILIMRGAISPFVASNINQSSSTLENNSVRPPRYRFNSKPDAFMNNGVWKAAMANIIDKIETAQYNQLEIDRMYNDMCSIICKEMDK